MNLLPYQIEQTLTQLEEELFRAQEEGDSEAIVAIEKCIAEYLTSDPVRVGSYVGVLKKLDLSEEACTVEINRIKDIRDGVRRVRERMVANAMATLRRFGVRALDSEHGGGLRIQGNGGLEPLEILDWPKDSSGRWVPLPADSAPRIPVKLLAVPDTEFIRASLKRDPHQAGMRLLERTERLVVK